MKTSAVNQAHDTDGNPVWNTVGYTEYIDLSPMFDALDALPPPPADPAKTAESVQKKEWESRVSCGQIKTISKKYHSILADGLEHGGRELAHRTGTGDDDVREAIAELRAHDAEISVRVVTSRRGKQIHLYTMSRPAIGLEREWYAKYKCRYGYYGEAFVAFRPSELYRTHVFYRTFATREEAEEYVKGEEEKSYSYWRIADDRGQLTYGQRPDEHALREARRLAALGRIRVLVPGEKPGGPPR